MNLTNLMRDMAWLQPDQTGQALGTASAAPPYNVGLDGVVYDKNAFAWQANVAATWAGLRAIGVAFEPPVTGEPTPYRVKAYSAGSGFLPVFGIGRLAGAVVAGSNAMTNAIWISSQQTEFDEILCISPSIAGPTNPLAFWVGGYGASSANCVFSISVQRLLGKPLAYASGVA